MIRRLLTFLPAAIIVAATLSAQQSRSATVVDTHGNQYAGITRTASTNASKTNNRAKASFLVDLVGNFLKRELPIASVTVSGDSNGADSIKLKVAGITVLRSSSSSHPILHLTIWNVQATILDVGVFQVNAEASAGGGAQFGVSVTGTVSPPRINVNGAAQVYGNSEGGVSVTLLYGVAKAKVSLTVNFLNSTIRADLPVTTTGVGNVTVFLDTILWQLFLKAKGEVLWGLASKSKTFVDEKGPSYTRQLL